MKQAFEASWNRGDKMLIFIEIIGNRQLDALGTVLPV